ncbi:MAG: lipid A deacylase LpxR family protein [Bacillota bacterium]
MRHSFLKPIAGCLLLTASAAALAGSFDDLFSDYRKVSTEGKTSHIIDIDNDTLLLNNSDGFYTSGMRYAQAHTLADGARATTFGWRIGQELYTASDIKLPPELIGPPDHPYAGWLYGGFFKEVSQADGGYTRLGIDIGCLGPCAGGEWTQRNFHRVINQPLPRGWSKQVRNEAGVVLYADVAPARWTPGASLDVTPRFNARFGNIYTDAGAGLTVRAGRLNLLPNQRTFHGFVRADVHAVGYNATLQGGYFSDNNPHTVTPRRWVGEAEAGIVWQGEQFGARVGLVRRSNEIRDLSNSIGAQDFLRLQFSYTP